MIKNLNLEKRVLSGILQHQNLWGEIAEWISEKDFYSEDTIVHKSLFSLLRVALNNKESIDEIILIGRLNQLGISFPDEIDLPEYVRSLMFFKIDKEVFLTSIKELKKVTLRRNFWESSEKTKKYVKTVDPSITYGELITELDNIHNTTVANFEIDTTKSVNLAEIAPAIIEDRGNNPPTQVGIMSPHKTLNKIYGSLFRGGNITCIAARAKVGKTSFIVDTALKTSYDSGVSILHFDNGEMSKEELVFRMVSGMSGIPVYLLESGDWRRSSYGNLSAAEVVAKVRAVWPKMEKIKILYENVAGASGDEMKALLKRKYYSEVGRGKEMIFSFDYLKTDFNNLGKGSEWAYVGKMLDGFKQLISRELVYGGVPKVPMITSVQLNRFGITTNRTAETVGETESENAIGLSDNIIQFVSHLFLLRKKTLDERVTYGERFGSHSMVCLAARHLGKDAFGHLNSVQMPDGSHRNNFLNFNFENFDVKDCGDLRDIVSVLNNDDVRVRNESAEIPDGL